VFDERGAMSDRTTEPDVFHDVFSCERGDETRTYSMRVIPGGAELWRMTESPRGGMQSIKEGDFKSSEEAARFLQELRDALTAGGWRDA
jgi:hypothetical protein